MGLTTDSYIDADGGRFLFPDNGGGIIATREWVSENGGGGGSGGIDDVLGEGNDAGDQLIKNVANPVDSKDVVNKQFLLGTLGDGQAGHLKYVAVMYMSLISQEDGELIIGNEYVIQDYHAGDDFTNVGAASNDPGTIFTAIGTTPTEYSNGSILINNTLSAPQSYIFENTIGNIVWTRTGVGTYLGTLAGAFTGWKTWSMVSQTYGGIVYMLQRDGPDVMTLSTLIEESGTLTPNDALHDVPIEIRVYP